MTGAVENLARVQHVKTFLLCWLQNELLVCVAAQQTNRFVEHLEKVVPQSHGTWITAGVTSLRSLGFHTHQHAHTTERAGSYWVL